MSTRLTIPLVTALALLAAIGVWAEPMQFTNPGFELDENADGLPDGWQKAVHGDNFEIALSEDFAHSGERSVRITGLPDHGDRACVLQRSKPALAAVAYHMSVFVRGEGRGTGILRFHYTDAQGEPADMTHHFDIAGFNPDDWHEFTIDLAAPKAMRDAAEGAVEIILYQRGDGDLYYDDLSVETMDVWAPKLTEAQQATATPRAPAGERRVLQNPPGLTWPGEQFAHRYELQLARDVDFTQGLITIADLPYNCLQYSAPLAPGDWHWRYRYSDTDGNASEWSESWRFEVPADAVEFTLPAPDDLLALIPAGHPRVYTCAEKLEEFRGLRGDRDADPWWQSWNQRMANWLKTDVPSEPGPEFDFSQRQGSLTADGMAKMNELRGMGGRATTPMWELAFGYLISGNEEWGRSAADRLVAMSSWDPEGSTGYRSHDQVFRDIAWKSACAYDWLHDLLTDEQRTLVRDSVAARGAILYRDFAEDARPIYQAPFDSHGWTSMGLLGVISIALAHDVPEADEWFRFTSAVYPVLYPPWGGEEGGWCQGPSYWKYSVSYAAIYMDALKSATGVNMYDKAFCRNNGYYKLYMHPPWCDRAHFGDENIAGPGYSDRMNMLMYATLYDDPYFKWYADQIPGTIDKGVFGYWRYDESQPARPPADIPQSRYFADIGWVGMHSDLSDPNDIMLMFKSSWFGSFNHSHADQNSFVVYGHGEPLLIDSGYYDWYGAPHDRSWTRETKAHNDILVDGEGQPVFDITARGEITDYFEAPPGCYTVGDASAAYGGKLSKFVRHVLYLRPDAFLIVDELEADEPRTWTWTCHALEEMEIDEDARRVRVKQGDATLDIAFAAPTGLTIRRPQGRYADLPDQWHCYAETTEPSTTQRFVTLMRVGEGGEAPELTLTEAEAGEGFSARMGPVLAIVREGGDTPVQIRGGNFDGDMVIMGPPELGMGQVSALAVHAREFERAFTASRPATVALRVDVDAQALLDANARVTEPTELKLWSVPTLTLDLPPGQHAITRADAHDAIGGVSVTMDGALADLAPETVPVYSGGQLLLGELTTDPGLYTVAAYADARVSINSSALSVDGGIVWLNETNAIEARLAKPSEIRLDMTSITVDSEPRLATVLDELPADAIVIEAETFTDSGGGTASRYSHRTFLSGGVGVGEWTIPGMWITWRLNALPGRYHLVLKGSTHETHADRLILLDDQPISDGFLTHRFAHTGGFGATPEEWQDLLVTGADGEPLRLDLTDGTHTLTMVCLANRLNLDYLALIPAL